MPVVLCPKTSGQKQPYTPKNSGIASTAMGDGYPFQMIMMWHSRGCTLPVKCQMLFYQTSVPIEMILIVSICARV